MKELHQGRTVGNRLIESIEKIEGQKTFQGTLAEKLEANLRFRLPLNTVEEAVRAAENISYPVVLRPAFTLGRRGGFEVVSRSFWG